MSVMKVDLPYLFSDVDRHGNWRLFVRRNGRKIRMRHDPGTDAFAKAYAEALAELERPPSLKPPQPGRPTPGTLGALALAYFASGKFRRLDPVTQRRKRAIIEACLVEPRKQTPGGAPEGPELFRDCPLEKFSSTHVRVLRDRKAELVGAANQRRKALSAMFGWAQEDGWTYGADHKIIVNPVRDVKKIRYATDGWYTWTVDDVGQYMRRHRIGTKAGLALSLLLFTGVRRSDVVKLGRQHIRNGWLSFVATKTRKVRAAPVEIPVLPILSEAIAAGPTGNLTFLITEFGKPFTAAGFGNWFRDRCDEAGLPHCSAHGLRKAGATIAADNGATDRQLMAMYGWTSESQATPYTRKANRKRLAKSGMGLIDLTHQNKGS
jgi:integrase